MQVLLKNLWWPFWAGRIHQHSPSIPIFLTSIQQRTSMRSHLIKTSTHRSTVWPHSVIMLSPSSQLPAVLCDRSRSSRITHNVKTLRRLFASMTPCLRIGPDVWNGIMDCCKLDDLAASFTIVWVPTWWVVQDVTRLSGFLYKCLYLHIWLASVEFRYVSFRLCFTTLSHYCNSYKPWLDSDQQW